MAQYRNLRDELVHRIQVLLGQGYLDAFALLRDRRDDLVDSLDVGILVHDRYRRIARFNRAAEEITGLKRARVLGRDCHQIFQGEGFCGPDCKFCGDRPDLPDSGRTSYRILYHTPQGDRRRLHLAVQAFFLGDTEVPGAMVVIRDETEMFELQRRLRETKSFHGMVGVSPGMQQVFQTVEQVAFSDYPVLITGESGTGKELVAQAIHQESPRRQGPFVPVNCGALPENILESELFGHVRGAFTGAIRDKKGRFELAHGGHPVPRRSGGTHPSPAGQAPPGPAGEAIRAGRRGEDGPGGRPTGERHQPGPAEDGGPRVLPGGISITGCGSSPSTSPPFASGWRTCPTWSPRSWKGSGRRRARRSSA